MTELTNITMDMTNNQTNIVPSKKGKEECEICGEFINKSTHKKITCPFDACSQSCCSKCFARFLMESGLSSVCMWCKKDLSSEFVEDNTTKKFYKEYIDYRTGIHVDRAKGELPELQEQADAVLRKRKYAAEIIKRNEQFFNISEKISRANFELETVYELFGITGRNPFTKPTHIKPTNWEQFLEIANGLTTTCFLCMKNSSLSTCDRCNLSKCVNCFKLCLVANDTRCVVCNTEDEISIEDIERNLTRSFYTKFFKPKNRRQNKPEMENFRIKAIEAVKTKLEVNVEIITLCLDLYQIRNGLDFNTNRVAASVEKKEKTFIKKCPDSECRGFLSSAWKCGICSDFFCSDCHAKKQSRTDEEHVCNEAEKATVALLKTDSKPCPGCSTMIHRYTGCSQVWTPCCKIAFDWNTGKIVSKGERIHSPEYYDYMRRVNNGVVPREVYDNPCGGIVTHWQMQPLFRREIRLERYHQLMEHVNLFIIPTLPRIIGDFHRDDLGVSYLVSDIDENGWKVTLKKRIKKDEKNNHIFHILNMFVNVMNDFFTNLLTDRDLDLFFANADQVIVYTNEQIGKINKRYGSVSKEFFVVLRE